MGREIWIEVWNDKDEIVFDSIKDGDCFCGRNPCTDVIALYKNRDKDDKVDFTDWDTYQYLRACLNEEQHSLDSTLDELNESIAAARDARHHASTVEAFYDFTELIKQLRRDRADGQWDLGNDMMALMLMTISRTALVVSKDKTVCCDGWEQMELIKRSGWHLYWVISE